MPRISARTGAASKSLRAKPARRTPLAALADLDTQLMLQLGAGDTDAGNTLVRRNFDRVARYVARIVRDRHPVEDLTQDVFLQVFKVANRYEPTARFSTWLYRIATNAARNYLTQAYVKRRRSTVDDEPPVPARGDTAPERQLSLDELRGRVAAALSSLPVNQRIALTLFEFEGLSYEQIAAVLETTVDAVRSQLKRARETLRPKLRGLI